MLTKEPFILYGRNSVLERLKVNPKSIRKILIENDFDASCLVSILKANKLPIERLYPSALARIRRGVNTQGIIAIVDKFEYADFKELLNKPASDKLVLLFLDRIWDPQNLGAILRSAACYGGFAVISPKDKACDVNETVLHIASGGENYVPVSLVSNLSNAIIAAKKSGYWIIGTLIDDKAKDINKTSFPFPLGLVLGSEGEGIRYGVQKQLDMEVQIPMHGARLSLNVAVACAIFCNEISKQKK